MRRLVLALAWCWLVLRWILETDEALQDLKCAAHRRGAGG